MKPGFLTGLTAALAVAGTAGAQAETIYLTEPAFVETTPAYAIPAPIVEAPPAYTYAAPMVVDRGYYVTVAPDDPAAEQPAYVVVAPPAGYIVDRSVELSAPRSGYGYRYRAPARRAVPARAVDPVSCAIDADGFERCY